MASLGQRHSWENESSGPEEAGEAAIQEAAGVQLVELLVALMWSANLSARTICILAYWAHRAGAVGGVSELAVAPGKQSAVEWLRNRAVFRFSKYRNQANASTKWMVPSG